MLAQYCFKVSRICKQQPIIIYHICHNVEEAKAWIIAQGKLRKWGLLGLDWQIQSITSRSLDQVYETTSDKVGYLCELTEELFAREISNNCPNAEFRELSWNDLCEAAITILKALKK